MQRLTRSVLGPACQQLGVPQRRALAEAPPPLLAGTLRIAGHLASSLETTANPRDYRYNIVASALADVVRVLGDDSIVDPAERASHMLRGDGTPLPAVAAIVFSAHP